MAISQKDDRPHIPHQHPEVFRGRLQPEQQERGGEIASRSWQGIRRT